MSRDFDTPDSKMLDPGYAHDVSSPITGGTQYVPTSGAKILDRNHQPIQKQPEQQGRARYGSPIFYDLLQKMADIHDNKSHDYASNNDPSGNYHFAGKMSKLFDNPDDAGFAGRMAEKLYRLANLENNNRIAKNESIEDTEYDLCVIMVLWMSDRISRRLHSKAPSKL